MDERSQSPCGSQSAMGNFIVWEQRRRESGSGLAGQSQGYMRTGFKRAQDYTLRVPLHLYIPPHPLGSTLGFLSILTITSIKNSVQFKVKQKMYRLKVLILQT